MSTNPQKTKGELAKPTDLFGRFRQEMDDFISNFTTGLPDSPFAFALDDRGFAIDVAETDGAVEVTAELPGLDSDDVEVTVDGGSLTISAEKQAEKKVEDKNWHRVERSYGSFKRIIPLGFVPDADSLEAELKKGVLHVTVPKPAEKNEKAKKVAVKAG
ncbi:MAG: Hsp20/alpha crystallin family protein [Rhizobiaceae bacterium]